MKFTAVLALFLSTTQAIRFNDMPSEENTEILSDIKKREHEDELFLKQIDVFIDQAGRNTQQGEIGRTLAMNKINEIKLQLS